MFAKMVSDMMIKPGNSPVFDHPGDFGLSYQDVEFVASDGVKLRGWLIEGGSDKVVIQTHFGVQCSRSGYTPKGKGMIKMSKEDISFLRQARALNEQGYSVLMYDMRNHGESDLGTCPWVSWGPEEAKDVIAAVNFVSSHPHTRDANIGLLSICMGSAASTYAYGLGEAGLARFSNIKAMIAVQPLHYQEFVKAFGMPAFLDRAGSKLSHKRIGFDLNTKTFIPDVSSITVPTMVVQNKNDPWTNLDFVERYFSELKVEKEMFWVELGKSRAAAYDFLGTSPQPLVKFFDRYL
ncbi:MAG: alpha/beta fold hydrolase [Acidobacteriota bacterium]